MILTSLKTILPASLTESGGKLGSMLLRHLHSCLWSSQASFYSVFEKGRERKKITYYFTQKISYLSICTHKYILFTVTYTCTQTNNIQPCHGLDLGIQNHNSIAAIAVGWEERLSSQKPAPKDQEGDLPWILISTDSGSLQCRQPRMLPFKKTAAHTFNKHN